MSKLVKAIDTLESRLAGTSLGFRFNVPPVAEPESPKATAAIDNAGKKIVVKSTTKPKRLLKSSSPGTETALSPPQLVASNQDEKSQANSNGNSGITPSPVVAESELVAVLPTFLDDEIFSKKDTCLYLYLVGNCYRRLLEKETASEPTLLGPPMVTSSSTRQSSFLAHKPLSFKATEFMSRCLKAYREACTVAAKSLEISDALRLACLYALCRALNDLSGEFQEAKAIALTTYDIGTKHGHTLTDVAVSILQRIRDEFLVLEAPAGDDEDGDDDDDSVLGDGDATDASAIGSAIVEIDGERPTNSRRKSQSGRIHKTSKKSSKRLNAALLESIEQQYTANLELAQPVITENGNSPGETTAATATIPSTMGREMQDLVLTIKRAMFIPSPVPLDSFSSGLEIFKALDTIFKVYIRGNALAGLQSTGSEVAISNRQLALSKFLLEGPFLSWRGFSSVLVDFKVLSRHDPILSIANAEIAAEKEKLASNAADDEDGEIDDDTDLAPLKAMQAAIIFLECSGRSHFKSVAMDAYLSFRFEESKEDVLEPDSWLQVYSWAGTLKPDVQKNQFWIEFLAVC